METPMFIQKRVSLKICAIFWNSIKYSIQNICKNFEAIFRYVKHDVHLVTLLCGEKFSGV